MSDGYHSGERFSVVREVSNDRWVYAVVDHQNDNLRYSRHYSSNAAHRHADELNAQYRAEQTTR